MALYTIVLKELRHEDIGLKRFESFLKRNCLRGFGKPQWLKAGWGIGIMRMRFTRHPGHQTSPLLLLAMELSQRKCVNDNLNKLTELKDAMNLYVRILVCVTVEKAVMRFNLLSGNGVRHIEHAL